MGVCILYVDLDVGTNSCGIFKVSYYSQGHFTDLVYGVGLKLEKK